MKNKLFIFLFFIVAAFALENTNNEISKDWIAIIVIFFSIGLVVGVTMILCCLGSKGGDDSMLPKVEPIKNEPKKNEDVQSIPKVEPINKVQPINKVEPINKREDPPKEESKLQTIPKVEKKSEGRVKSQLELDEEFARKMQEDENRLSRSISSNPKPKPEPVVHVTATSQPSIHLQSSDPVNLQRTATPVSEPKPEIKTEQKITSTKTDPKEEFVPRKTPLPSSETNSEDFIQGYSGNMDRREAENLLMYAEPGVYLVRWSDRMKFYAISYVTEDRRMLHMGEILVDENTKKVRVLREDGLTTFGSLNQYIAKMKEEGIFKMPLETSHYVDIPPGQTPKVEEEEKKPEKIYEDW